MLLDGTEQSLEQVGASLIRAGSHTLRVWPKDQRVQELGDPRILGTQFPDCSLFHDSAIALVMRAAANLPPNVRGYGGRKVRDAATWNSPELTLLNWRALYFFCASRGVRSGHVVDRWINVMEHDDYSSAHCHFESDAAIVYSLDPGERNPHRAADGRPLDLARTYEQGAAKTRTAWPPDAADRIMAKTFKSRALRRNRLFFEALRRRRQPEVEIARLKRVLVVAQHRIVRRHRHREARRQTVVEEP